MVATKAKSSVIPPGTLIRGGTTPRITSVWLTIATAANTATAATNRHDTPWAGGAGAAASPSSRSTRVASRAGQSAAATAIPQPKMTATGMIHGSMVSVASGAWSARVMPAEIGPAAARPTAAPRMPPTTPRIAASLTTSQ